MDQARQGYDRALEYVDETLRLSPRYYAAQYTRWLALAGLASLSDADGRDSLMTRARDAHEVAVSMCKSLGVVQSALLLLHELPVDTGFMAQVQVAETVGAPL